MSEFVPKWRSVRQKEERRKDKKKIKKIMRGRQGIDCIVNMAADNPIPPNLRNAMRQDKPETLKVISCSWKS
jgi:hypothetical protein